MLGLGLALGVIAVFFTFGYLGLPILFWTIAAALFGWALSVLAGFGPVTNIVLGTLFVLVAAVLNISVLRRKIVSDHILAIYRRILPDMTQTENRSASHHTVPASIASFSVCDMSGRMRR